MPLTARKIINISNMPLTTRKIINIINYSILYRLVYGGMLTPRTTSPCASIIETSPCAFIIETSPCASIIEQFHEYPIIGTGRSTETGTATLISVLGGIDTNGTRTGTLP